MNVLPGGEEHPSRYNIPYLVDRPGQGRRVGGEVYRVDTDMLANLDILEDHPTYYRRRHEEVVMDGGGRMV